MRLGELEEIFQVEPAAVPIPEPFEIEREAEPEEEKINEPQEEDGDAAVPAGPDPSKREAAPVEERA